MNYEKLSNHDPQEYTMKLLTGLFSAVVALLVAGCGAGSAGSGGGIGGGTPTISITLERASDGQKNVPVTPGEPARVVIRTTTDDLVTLATTVGALSKTSVAPVNGRAEVILSVTLNDTNDGEITAVQSNGATTTAAFNIGAINLSIGRLLSGVFTNGQLEIGQANLSPGGTTQITAVVWENAANAPYSLPINVNFTSTCISTGQSTISSPILAVNGIASTTYKAVNCQGTDVITASISVGGSIKTATGAITFPAAASNSIEFVEANPDFINLVGVGTSQTEVKFLVRDVIGNPVSNVTVDFALNTTVGGLSLTAFSNQTDASGLVSTYVTPGSVPTAVRVTATVRNTSISTQSSQLSVTTGLPAQDRISVAVGTHAVEALEYDGVTVPITVYVADRYGNPSPDNTAVTFRSEANGGALFPASCLTVDGTCGITWRSQGTRNFDSSGTVAAPQRITILATALGEESFVDANGNGRYDSGETIRDLPEAYVDNNESGVRDIGEEFVDFNINGVFDNANGLFSGALCNSGCAPQNSLHVRSWNNIIMSSSVPKMVNGSPSALDVRGQTIRSTAYTLYDRYNQPMPAGTKVTCATTVGAIQTPSSYVLPDSTAGGYPFSCTVKGTGPVPTAGQTCTLVTGAVRVTVETPRGLVSYLPEVQVTDYLKCNDVVLPQAPTISTNALPDGDEPTGPLPADAVAYPATLLAASGGKTPYTWTATNLPSGLNLQATTGFLSGAPACGTSGVRPVTLTVTGSDGGTSSTVLLLTINDGACD